MRVPKILLFPKDIENYDFYKACSAARIFLGLILCHRFLDLCISSPLNVSTNQIIKHFIGLGLSIFTTIGIFLPITIPLISLTNSFTAINLGGQITAIILIIIFFGKCWRHLSIDNFFINKNKLYSKLYLFFENLNLNPQAIRLFGLWLWGGICFSAMSYHFNDSSWIKGTAVLTLLRTPYLNDYYQIFNNINDSILIFLSAISLYLMAIWELIIWIIPGIKILREITFWWGIAFFVSSVIFINLSYLPYFEIILWLLLYKPYLFSKLIPNSNTEHSIEKFKPNFLINVFSIFTIVSGIISILIINTGNLIHLFGKNYTQRVLGYKIKSNIFSYFGGRFFGQAPVDVFNQNDLEMNQYSLLVCRKDKENNVKLVPFQDGNGGRLRYLANDNFYFVNSLKFQRWSKGKSNKQVSILWEKLANKVIDFDFELNKSNTKSYKAYLLEHSPNFINSNVLAGWNIKNKPKIIKVIEVSKENIKKNNSLRLSLPPGHFNESKRIKEATKNYCQN